MDWERGFSTSSPEFLLLKEEDMEEFRSEKTVKGGKVSDFFFLFFCTIIGYSCIAHCELLTSYRLPGRVSVCNNRATVMTRTHPKHVPILQLMVCVRVCGAEANGGGGGAARSGCGRLL